ncbi:hypothetical protein H4V95_000320 [Arthrobacter sp. CAN_C5]|nr:hypothetical protein [Arthrobacter sp. CAN_C5]
MGFLPYLQGHVLDDFLAQGDDFLVQGRVDDYVLGEPVNPGDITR